MLLKASCSLSPVAPCICITKPKKFLFISTRQNSKAEEKRVTGGGRWIEIRDRVVAGALKMYKCQSLQGPSLRTSSLRAWWSCGYGDGVLLLFPIHDPCLPLSQLSQPAVGTRGQGMGNLPCIFSLGSSSVSKQSLLLPWGGNFRVSCLLGTCCKYQIDELQHVLKEQQITVLNASSRQLYFHLSLWLHLSGHLNRLPLGTDCAFILHYDLSGEVLQQLVSMHSPSICSTYVPSVSLRSQFHLPQGV